MQSDTSIPNLVPKREVDQATGEATVNYYWGGQLTQKVEVSGKLVEQLNGYSLIRKDLDNALKWIQLAEKHFTGKPKRADSGGYVQIKDRDAGDTVKAFFVASLTFYGKCFTKAAGRHVQVSRGWLDKRHRDVHDFYMGYRHNFAAHSGDECLEFAKTYVLVHPDKEKLLPYLPTARLQPDVVLPSQGEIGLGELIRYLSTKVTEKHNKLGQKIFNEHVMPRGATFWMSAVGETEPVKLEVPKRIRG